MKHYLTFLWCLLISASTLAQTPAWKSYAIDQRLTVRFPAAPQELDSDTSYFSQSTSVRKAYTKSCIILSSCRAYTPRTTDSTHGLRCAPNRLLDQSKPTQDNRVWVSDIMYLPLVSGQ
jgi:hypothetical protein